MSVRKNEKKFIFNGCFISFRLLDSVSSLICIYLTPTSPPRSLTQIRHIPLNRICPYTQQANRDCSGSYSKQVVTAPICLPHGQAAFISNLSHISTGFQAEIKNLAGPSIFCTAIGEKREIYISPKGICVKVNLMNSTEIRTRLPNSKNYHYTHLTL